MDFITDNILRNPPILLGLIAAIGLILQKQSAADIIKGALLTAFGMVILDAGVGMLVGSIIPINAALQSLGDAPVVAGLDDTTFTASFGGEVGMTMFIALILHLLIAKFTPIKTIFLTGHMLWWFPFIFVAAGVEGGLAGMPLVAFSAIFSALYFSVMPWLLRKYVFAVTGDDSFTLGHPTGILTLISGFVASKVGDTSKSTEDLNLPKGLSFFREISITGGFVIALMFFVIALIIPQAGLIAEGQNIVFSSIGQGLHFGAGLIIMLQGVRMLISQIVPAFKGISEKLVKDALPALDCPIIFNYKPNAVLIGFIVAMIISTAVVIVFNSLGIFGVIIIPLVITSFFECGAAAVIGEGQGGLRGAIIGTAVASIFMVVLVAVSAVVYANTIQNWMLIFGGNDLSLFGIIAKWIASIF